jgi:hypothetical protein
LTHTDFRPIEKTGRKTALLLCLMEKPGRILYKGYLF